LIAAFLRMFSGSLIDIILNRFIKGKIENSALGHGRKVASFVSSAFQLGAETSPDIPISATNCKFGGGGYGSVLTIGRNRPTIPFRCRANLRQPKVRSRWLFHAPMRATSPTLAPAPAQTGRPVCTAR
jgi:hypothetical protein